MMKKFLHACTACVIALALSACGSDAPSNDGSAVQDGAQAETNESESTPSIPDPDCVATVVVERDAQGKIVSAKLECGGTCSDGGACALKAVANEKGRRSWCSCGEEEPPYCHMVIFEPSSGDPRWFSPGGDGCSIIETAGDPTPAGNSVTKYTVVPD